MLLSLDRGFGLEDLDPGFQILGTVEGGLHGIVSGIKIFREKVTHEIHVVIYGVHPGGNVMHVAGAVGHHLDHGRVRAVEPVDLFLKDSTFALKFEKVASPEWFIWRWTIIVDRCTARGTRRRE